MDERNCPECGTTLTARATYCGCGWGKPKQKRGDQESGLRPWPAHCEYIDGTTHCKFPAVFSPSPRGGGPYYCRFHARSQGGMIDSLVCKQSQSFKPETKQDYDRAFQADVEASLKKLGLEQKQGESKQAWIERMREFCRVGARNLIKREVKQRTREPGDDDEEVAA